MLALLATTEAAMAASSSVSLSPASASSSGARVKTVATFEAAEIVKSPSALIIDPPSIVIWALELAMTAPTVMEPLSRSAS